MRNRATMFCLLCVLLAPSFTYGQVGIGEPAAAWAELCDAPSETEHRAPGVTVLHFAPPDGDLRVGLVSGRTQMIEFHRADMDGDEIEDILPDLAGGEWQPFAAAPEDAPPTWRCAENDAIAYYHGGVLKVITPEWHRTVVDRPAGKPQTAPGAAVTVRAPPGAGMAEQALVSGDLAAAEQRLLDHLAGNPDDDQTRFGLGFVQFLRGFEHFGQSLYRYGLRTGDIVESTPPPVQMVLPQNPDPEPVTYDALREMAETWTEDLAKAEATLAAISDDNVKLPLHLALVRVDFWSGDRAISARDLFELLQMDMPEDTVNEFAIAFDRGDVAWLRGYIHLLSGWGDLYLAVDSRELFDRTAHLLFQEVDSPHAYLQEEHRRLDTMGFDFDVRVATDLIALVHLCRFEVVAPERMQAAHAHFESMLGVAREMWTFYQAETDDDREWIPNPAQESVLGVAVTQPMIDEWLAVLGEAEAVLRGERLIPFWRGDPGTRGVNLRRVFTEPTCLDPVLWIQGTAATPYLETGPITRFADPDVIERLTDAFGGPAFFGFAAWFN